MALVFLFAFFFFILCGAVIYPIWMLFHCAMSPLNGKMKTIWLLVILFTWSLGAILYGLIRCEKRSAPWISAIALMCIGMISVFPLIKMYKAANNYAIEKLSKIDRLNTAKLSPDELTELKASLRALQSEVKSKNLERALRASHFSTLFSIYANDHQITPMEYREWIEKFNSRDMLDLNAFSAFIINKLKQKRELTS